jgi:hypothetical protein
LLKFSFASSPPSLLLSVLLSCTLTQNHTNIHQDCHGAAALDVQEEQLQMGMEDIVNQVFGGTPLSIVLSLRPLNHGKFAYLVAEEVLASLYEHKIPVNRVFSMGSDNENLMKSVASLLHLRRQPDLPHILQLLSKRVIMETLNTSDSLTAKSGARKSDARKSDASESDACKSDARQSDASESDASESDARKSDASESDAHGSDASESDACKSDASESDASESDARKSDASESDAHGSDAKSFGASIGSFVKIMSALTTTLNQHHHVLHMEAKLKLQPLGLYSKNKLGQNIQD